jgi:hypothetical protein
MMRRSAPFCWFYAIVILASFQVYGGESCIEECRDKVDCEIEVTRCLIKSNRARDAIDRLKILVQQHPKNPAFARLLTSAYVADNNPFWAQRVLEQSLNENPDNCESRSWLAWLYISEGDIDPAVEILKEPGCPVTEADRTRWRVLKLHMANARTENSTNAEALEAIGNAQEAYLEDQAMWIYLRNKEEPGWIEPLSIRMDVMGGYSSNARAGSPADPSASGDGSALGRFDMFARLVLPVSRIVRPVLEGNARGHGLAASEARDLSYLDLSIRPGVIFGGDFPRLLITYAGNLLLLNLDDKTLFYESHRGEAELETSIGLVVFAGAGRRIFHEVGRTRTELDGGLGMSISLGKHVQLFLALTGRYYWAVGVPYDQTGGTALIAGRVNLGAGFYARLGVTPGLDNYPNSGGVRGELAFGTKKERLDFLIKQFEELWSPSWHGVRIGLRYEFSWRDSNADIGESNYDYQEHRILAGIRWTFDANPWSPRVKSSEDHVDLNYGIDPGLEAGFGKERIQDLLRRDESTRAGSSCVD